MAAKSEVPCDPVIRWTLIILAAIVALYLYSIIADRMTPYTSQATVQAFIVRMAPEVSGRVQEVPVSDNQKVKAGDILFRIDPQTYEIALKQADARLASVGQTIGANTAAVAAAQERLIEAQAKRSGLKCLGWRPVPNNPEVAGPRAHQALPVIEQCFFAPETETPNFEFLLFHFRKEAEAIAPVGTYFCSLSCRTVVYKGLLTPFQLPAFYADLRDPDF